MNSKLTVTTLTDQVEADIIEYVRQNKLIMGYSLPNEKKFVEIFSIGRNLVREAMCCLRMWGIMELFTKMWNDPL
jgi:GntR family transcriptional regulator, transcriptional repressor for pyruvate dehydrogenase complex